MGYKPIDSIWSTSLDVGTKTGEKWLSACPLSTIESALNNASNIPTHATVTKVMLIVGASAQCNTGSTARIFIRYGFGGAESISKELVASTRVQGGSNHENIYNYPSDDGIDIVSYLNTKAAPNIKLKRDYGDYLAFAFESANIGKKQYYVKWVKLNVTYTDGSHSYNSTVTLQPTCTSAGVRTYTCSCGHSYTESIPALGHSYGTPTYTWSADGKTCTAKRVCGNNSSHTETATATITSAVKTAATCTAKGTTRYTATFNVSWASAQTKDIQDIPAKGHSWKSATCTAPKTCSVCGATEGSALGHSPSCYPEITSLQMLYQNKQISADNKVPAGEYFRIVVGAVAHH